MKSLLRKWVIVMMNKFWFLTGSSLKKKLKSKWFYAVNILLLVVIVGIMNVDGIIKAFGGEFNETNQLVVLDETGYSYSIIERNINSYNDTLDKGYSFDIKNDDKSQRDLYYQCTTARNWCQVRLKQQENYEFFLKMLCKSTRMCYSIVSLL